MRCLIVDDDYCSLSMLKEILPSSYKIDVAVNGYEAVELFRIAHKMGKPYGVICMDIEMPLMNGDEALRIIRHIESELKIPSKSEVKVIVISSHDETKMIMDTFNRGGATAYLIKPLNYEMLKLEICNL